MRLRLASALAAAVAFGSCSGSTPAATNVGEQYAVGVQTQTLVDQRRSTPANGAIPGHPGRTLDTTILYPAEGSPAAQPIHDAPPDHRHGPYPLIVFAHGFGGDFQGYEELLRRWAQSGYVVVAPLFPLSRNDAPGGPTLADYVNQPGDLSFVITETLRAATGHAGLLAGLVDPRRIGAAGHSLGGVTTLALVANTCCRDRRVRAAVVMAGDPVSFPSGAPSYDRAPPLLLVHGDADQAVPYQSSIDAFKAAGPPKGLLTINGGDHVAPVDPAGPAFASVVRATIDFFDTYLKGDQPSLIRLRVDGEPHVTQLAFATSVGEQVSLPTPPATVAHRRQATVTPEEGLTDGQDVTISWRGYAPGVTVNVLECSKSPPTSPSDCDLQSAKLLQPDPQGTGSLSLRVHTGAVGAGSCDAQHPGCVVAINEGGSLAPQATVVVSIAFRP